MSGLLKTNINGQFLEMILDPSKADELVVPSDWKMRRLCGGRDPIQ